jgi:hypothetical protein
MGTSKNCLFARAGRVAVVLECGAAPAADCVYTPLLRAPAALPATKNPNF